jgi:threonyl-tRNA synthetase
MNKADLFKVSGHYEKFKEDMLRVVSNYTDEEYFLKPMNCPQHTQIFSSKMRSYKELPIRISDFANLYRDEKPGELSGLTRLRCFCQDDGHCFCREDQIKEEFASVLGAIQKAMQTYKMEYKIRLSLWDPKKPEKYLGEPAVWENSQKLLEEILIENKIEYVIGVGEAAMYGPKMDLMAKDSLGREWQISTIQLDFIMPKRFQLEYIDSDGEKKTPVMIHRAITGSPERFLGILIEHYAGAFPVWLSPTQVMVVPVSEKFDEYAQRIVALLKEKEVRVELDNSAESLGKRIRNAEKQKIPYMLIVGEKEMTEGIVTVRLRGEKEQLSLQTMEFVEKILDEIAQKK